jgi:hypothetical protein
MGAPRRGSGTSTTQIEVEWDALVAPDNGGSAISSYQLLWDAGSGGTPTTPVVGLVSDFLATSYAVSVAGSAGASYQFRLSAKNIYGWGVYSEIVAIVASSAPSQMQVVTTSVVGTNVRIQWTPPAGNGASITGYDIEIRQSDGTTFSEETTGCDGTALVAVLQCDIPFTTLRAAPFSLVLGDLVAVRARAINSVGLGPYSQLNVDGATI